LTAIVSLEQEIGWDDADSNEEPNKTNINQIEALKNLLFLFDLKGCHLLFS